MANTTDARGYAQLTVTTGSALKLSTTSYGTGAYPSVPGPNTALITVSGAPVRFTDDGTTVPTSTIGVPLSVGQILSYDGDPGRLQFIGSGSSSATLDILFGRRS